MYKNEDQFVLGQKIKIVIIGMIFLFLLVNHFITGTPIFR